MKLTEAHISRLETWPFSSWWFYEYTLMRDFINHSWCIIKNTNLH